MTKVAIAGVGFMGWIHYLAYQRVPGADLIAFCTRDAKKRAGDWTGIQGNFGPPGEQIDVSEMTCYESLDELLQDARVELVDNCLPPHLHADFTIQALEAGKHVFCEKPMALTTQECDRMMAAAQASGKQLLIGHVLPMFPEYARAREIAASGKYGRVIGGHFKRVISDPLWLDDFFDPTRVGGPLVDLHVHDAHFIRLLFGMPKRVCSRGRFRGDVVEYCDTIFDFDDPSLVVSASSGVINQQGRPFTHAFEIHLEQATLLFDLAVIGTEGRVLMPLTILGPDGEVTEEKLSSGDDITAFEAEIREVLQAIQSDQPSEVLDGGLARDAILLCHCQTESARSRAAVAVA